MATENLNEFISLVRTRGLLTNNKFYVVIPGLNSGRDLVLLCDSVNIPGSQFATVPVRMFGEETAFVHTFMYDKIQMTFLLDKTLIAKRSIDTWMDQVMNKNTRFIGYYADFVKEVDIYVQDKAGNSVLKTTLHETYPFSVQDITLSNDSRDVMKLQVSFIYKWWTSETLSANTDNSIIQGINRNNITGSINQYISNIQQFQSLFGNSPAGLGNETQTALTGSLGTLLPGVFPVDTTGSFYDMMNNYGTVLPNTFNRTAQIAFNAYSISNIDKNLSSALILGTQGIARNMQMYGAGVISLGQNPSSVTQGAGQVSSSLMSMTNNLSLINIGLDSVGAGTPFDANIISLGGAASSFGQIQSIDDLPSQLSGTGSVFSTIGANFINVIPELSSHVQLDTNVSSALRRTGSTFITAGFQSQNVASDISTRISVGEFL